MSRRTDRKGADQSGFTLLEVMIAVAILGTALISLLGLRNTDIRMVGEAAELTRATLLARSLIFEAGWKEDLPLGIVEGDFGPEMPGYSWQRNVTVFPLVPGDRVRQVVVSVSWDEGQVDLTRFVESPK